MRLLMVEDEKRIVMAVKAILERARYVVDTAFEGNTGLDMAESGIYDALILDVMLPGMDGLALLRTLREDGVHTPVLMLTAKGSVEDRVRGLESGADYYLPKPFQASELLACLKAITRRGEDRTEEALAYGDLQLLPGKASLQCAGTHEAVRLGNKEYQLRELFLRNPGQILTRETLADRVWGLEDSSEYNQLEVYVSFLRKKLQFLGSDTHIRTARGIGYSLEADHD